jgi:hypothetical protein
VSTPWKGIAIAGCIAVLWFVAVFRPLAGSEHKWNEKTQRARARIGELSEDSSSLTEKRERALKLINAVGYNRPTTTTAQESRMLEQIEVACRLAPIGLIEVVRMQPETVAGPTVSLEGGEAEVKVSYIRHPVQVQTNGPLQGSIQFLADLRRTNPMMMVDRMSLASSDDTGFVRMRCVLSSWRPDPDTLVPSGGGKS